MSSALEILKERLAKGDISDSEYDRLSEKLSQGTQLGANADTGKASDPFLSTLAPPNAAVPKKKKSLWWLWGIGAVLLAVAAIGSMRQDLQGGLNVASISGTEGYNLTFVLSNTSGRSEDVVFWIDVNGREMCHTVMAVKAGYRYNVDAPCRSMPLSSFSLNIQWAKSSPTEVSLATRLNV